MQVQHISLSSISYSANKEILVTLLAQTLVEYGFLLKVQSIINYQPELLQCRQIATFEELFSVSPQRTKCPTRQTKAIPISKHFSEYVSHPINVTLTEISGMLKFMEESHGTRVSQLAVAYYSLLATQKCQGQRVLELFSKTSSDLKSVYDAKNYTIWLINRKLHGNRYDDHTTYLVFTRETIKSVGYTSIYSDADYRPIRLITSHVFIHYYHSTQFFEAISIQLALLHIFSALCTQTKTGLSVELFTYVIDYVVPMERAQLIYAQAWPKMSGILTQKFGFSTLVYDSGVLVLKENKNKDVSVFRLNDRPFKYHGKQLICSNKEGSKQDEELLELIANNWEHISGAIHENGNDYCFTFKHLKNNYGYDYQSDYHSDYDSYRGW